MCEGLLTGINCPNDSDHGQLYVRGDDRVCVLPECGYSEPHTTQASRGEDDIHERDTEPIPVMVLLCEADGCTRDADVTIVVRGLKREVCDICAETHHENLDAQHNEEHIAIDEERMEGIEGV